MTIWIVGQWFDDRGWEFCGAYAKEEDAVRRCVTQSHFVGPAEIDGFVSDDRHIWPGLYYPSEKQ